VQSATSARLCIRPSAKALNALPLSPSTKSLGPNSKSKTIQDVNGWKKGKSNLSAASENIKLCAYAQDLTRKWLRKRSAHLVEALLRVSDIRLLLFLFGQLLLLLSLSLSAPHVGAFMLFRRLLLRSLPALHVIGQKNSLRTLSIELLFFLEVLLYKCGSK
jgi:hypothetical protein